MIVQFLEKTFICASAYQNAKGGSVEEYIFNPCYLKLSFFPRNVRIVNKSILILLLVQPEEKYAQISYRFLYPLYQPNVHTEFRMHICCFIFGAPKALCNYIFNILYQWMKASSASVNTVLSVCGFEGLCTEIASCAINL